MKFMEKYPINKITSDGSFAPRCAGKCHQHFCWLAGPRGRRPSARAARRAVGLNLTKTVHVPLEVGTKGKQRLRATGKPPTWETPYYPLGRAGRIHQLLAALASLSVAAFFGNKISASRSRSGGEGIEGEGLERRGMILHAMGQRPPQGLRHRDISNRAATPNNSKK